MRTRTLTAVIALMLAHVGSAHADSPQTPTSEADALFREGRARMAAQDYTTACPLLAASFQRDPTTGTLLALAVCHERKGDLTDALAEYHEVASRSQTEARTDRENAARLRIAALEVQIARTTAAPPAAPAEQTAVCPAPLPVATPIPAQVAVQAEVIAAPAVEVETVAEPTVAVAPRRARALSPSTLDAPQPSRARSPARSDGGGMTFVQGTGLVLMGVGAFALGTAGAFTIEAINKNSDSNDGCVVNRCTESGRDDRLDARSAGTAATISALIGGALATTGVVMYFVTGDSERAPRSSASALAPWVGYRSFGAAAQGSF